MLPLASNVMLNPRDLYLAAAGVDHVIVLGAGGPLHAAAHGVEVGEFERVSGFMSGSLPGAGVNSVAPAYLRFEPLDLS
jgi:hypothetical protein